MKKLIAIIYYISLPFFVKTKISNVPFPVICCIFLFLLLFLYGSFCKIKIKRYDAYMLISIFFSLIWTFLGLSNGFHVTAWNEMMNYFNFLGGCFLSFLLIENQIVDGRMVLKIIVAITSIYFILKLTVLFLSFIKLIDYVAIDSYLKSIAGIRLPYSSGVFGMPRISSMGDNLVYALYGLCGIRLKKKYLAFLSGIMLVYTIAQMSRVYWFTFLVIANYTFLQRKEKRKSLILCWGYSIALCVVFAIIILDYNGVDAYDIFLIHIVKYHVEAPTFEVARLNQSIALLKMFDLSPLYGFGIGGYAVECVRDRFNLFNYEMWFLACLAKLGIIGSLLIVIANVWNLLKRCVSIVNIREYRGIVIILFGIWILSGVVTGSMFSSSNVLFVLLIFLYCKYHYSFKPSEV